MDTENIRCPYCGQLLIVVIDRSVRVQIYIEDCHVCCRPMELQVSVRKDGTAEVVARAESD